MRVLVTRATEDAERTAAELQRRGHSPVIAPLRERIRRETAWPSGPFDAVIATSRHAFGAESPPSALRALPCFCVGESTAKAARAAGFMRARALGKDVASLIDAAPEHLPRAARLLYLAGKPRHAAFEQAAHTLGYEVEVSERYAMERRTTLPPAAHDALSRGEIAAVLHYSAQSARAFVELAGNAGLGPQAGRLLHLCLSASIAAMLPPEWHHKIASMPEEEALLALLETQ
jgi:uroporphyrinogen-III synthase